MTEAQTVINVSDDTFEEVVLRSDIPVLVDFWAPWCGPCHMVSPIVEELSIEYAGKVKFVKANVDEARTVASSMGIMSIPTICVFTKGKSMAQQVGAQPKANLEEMIEKVLVEVD